VTGGVKELVVPLAGHTLLHVPEPDGGSGAVAVEPDGMGVDAGLNALSRGGGQGYLQDLVPRLPLHQLTGEDVLEAIARGQGPLQTFWGAILTEAKHIGVLLGVCAETEVHQADVAVEHIAREDNRIPLNLFLSLTLNRHTRVEPGPEPKIADALTEPPDHILRGGDAGLDDPAGEGLGDDPVGNLHNPGVGVNLRLGPALQPTDGKPLRALNPVGIVGPQRRRHLLILRVGQPIAEGKGLGAVNPDYRRVALPHNPRQGLPLPFMVNVPVRPVKGVNAVTRQCQALQFSILLQVEYKDGPTAGREHPARQKAHDDGILIVFAG